METELGLTIFQPRIQKRIVKIVPKLIVRFSVIFILKEYALLCLVFSAEHTLAVTELACILKMLGKTHNFILFSL